MNKAAETDATETKHHNLLDDLAVLRLRPEEAMVRIYRDHRIPFIRWAQSWTNLEESDLVDVFQDVVIVLLKNIRSGQLSELTASVRTYLFGIGKKVLGSKARGSGRVTFPGEEKLEFPSEFDPGTEHNIILGEEEQRLLTALEQLGDPCESLLRMTFYQNMKSTEIASKLGYASDDVVRTKRKRCLDKLKTLFTNANTL